MPELLSALAAFVAEHVRCGQLDGGLLVEVVWLDCTCGARIARQAGSRTGPARRANQGATE